MVHSQQGIQFIKVRLDYNLFLNIITLMARQRKNKIRLLKLRKPDPKKELQFELDFQSSLTTQQRFEMMFRQSNIMKEILIRNGYRKPFEIIKRK